MHDVTTRLRSIPSENFGCNNNKTLHPSTSHSTRTTRLLVSAAAALLVIASAGFGALFAWQVGSKHDVALGALSVMMAVGLEISKPFAISSAFASLRQWRVITAAALTLVGFLAVAYSLQAELTFMSATRGDLVAERASDRDAAQRAEERYRKAEADLAALKPSGSSKSATAAYLERRDALQNEMHQAEQDRRAVPIVAYADPGAVALSAYVGALGIKADPQQLGLWLPLVGVLALEIGAAFSVVLVRSIEPPLRGSAPRDTQTPVSTGDAVSQEIIADVSRGTPAKRPTKKRRDREPPSSGTGSDGQRRGLAAILEPLRDGQVVDLSQRKLARALGVGKSSVHRVLHQLAEQGAVMLQTTAAGTRLALA